MPRSYLALWLIVTSSGFVAFGQEQDVIEPKYETLDGRVTGILTFDTERLAAQEGRSGPAEAVVFIPAKGSFRWIYLQAPKDPHAEKLDFGIANGMDRRSFKAVRLATRELLKSIGIENQLHLVEIVVNEGEGSAAEDSLVATSIKLIDGTDEFPRKLIDLAKEIRVEASKDLALKEESINSEMDKLMKSIANGRKPTGKTKKADRLDVRWVPEKGALLFTVTRSHTDGFYLASQGVDRPDLKPTIAGTEFGISASVEFAVGKSGKPERVKAPTLKSHKFEIDPLRKLE